FSYTPLQSKDPSTRLLRLFRASDFQDEVRCEIWEAKLQPDLEYEALSYTWGTNPPSETIFLRDAHGEGRFAVRDNLDDALRHLRLADHDRVIWTDAICINQEDEIEKGRQIANMRTIYTQAKRVVVWLGKE
ncbi:hypothetical protein EK21DRAFT_19230, partial [Setomelanomma holmii]